VAMAGFVEDGSKGPHTALSEQSVAMVDFSHLPWRAKHA
jgi:hypothetical protein